LPTRFWQVAKLEDLGSLELKVLSRPVAAFNVAQSTGPAEARPRLTVVAKGPAALRAQREDLGSRRTSLAAAEPSLLPAIE
jgi:hypothetical protein